jgi:hypothetical protein
MLADITNKANQLHQIRSEKEFMDSSSNASLHEGGSREQPFSRQNSQFTGPNLKGKTEQGKLSEQDLYKFDKCRFDRFKKGNFTLIFPFNKATHDLSI